MRHLLIFDDKSVSARYVADKFVMIALGYSDQAEIRYMPFTEQAVFIIESAVDIVIYCVRHYCLLFQSTLSDLDCLDEAAFFPGSAPPGNLLRSVYSLRSTRLSMPSRSELSVRS